MASNSNNASALLGKASSSPKKASGGGGKSKIPPADPRDPTQVRPGNGKPAVKNPVKHHYLESDAELLFGTSDLSAIPDTTPDAELPTPGTLHAVARQVRGGTDDPVVRTADSPALYGPIATQHVLPIQQGDATSADQHVHGTSGSTPMPTMNNNSRSGSQLGFHNSVARGGASSVQRVGRGGGTTTPTAALTTTASGPHRPGSRQTAVRPGSAAVSSIGGSGDTDINDAIEQVVGKGRGDFAAELELIGRINNTNSKVPGGSKPPLVLGAPSPSQQQRAASQLSRASPAPQQSSSSISAEEYEAIARAPPESESKTATGKPLHVPYTPDVRAKLAPGTAGKSFVPPKPMGLKDYQLLAEACQRAGRARMEGHAYYKIGELLSQNKTTVPKAVSYFKRYLNLSRRLNDLQGEAKALNCLGITHQEMGGDNNFHIALEYHRQHAEIADAAGIFIANTNMGLLHAKLGDLNRATEAHKQALQYAVRAGDRAAEALALVNLGQAGAQKGDYATARVCVERHLELSTTLQDTQSSCEAYEQLGALAGQRHDAKAASENLLLALDLALRENDQAKAHALRCQIGMVQGSVTLEDRMRDIATKMGAAQKR